MPHRGRELQQRYPRAGEIELADLGGDWLAVGRRCCRSVIRITSRDATHIHASEFFLQRRPLAGIWVLGRMGSGEAAKGIRRPALRGQGGPEDQIGPDARGSVSAGMGLPRSARPTPEDAGQRAYSAGARSNIR
jgi:hypothetical protein